MATRCSPYDPVESTGNYGEVFKPKVSIGPSWQVAIQPGGDNYYQETGKKVPCWEKPWRPQTTNHLERVACQDLGNFDATVLLNRRENVTSFKADALLESVIHCESLGTLKDALEGFQSEKNPRDCFVLTGNLEFWALQKIQRKSALRGLDSVLLSLYTKVKEDEISYFDSFWVFGTKSAEAALKTIVSCYLKAEQQIDLLSGLAFSSRPVVFKLDLPLKDQARLKSSLGLQSVLPVETTLRLGDLCFIGKGFALQGYGEGAYGL